MFTASPAFAAQVFTAIVSHVTDGDTLWVRLDRRGAEHKLRIDGIDAPEICQTGGEAARAVLSQLVLHQRVTVTIRRVDAYGRGLARIRLAGDDVGGRMVRSGQAWSYRWRHDPGPYAVEEARARQAGLGLFSASQAEHPRDFRKHHGPCHLVGK